MNYRHVQIGWMTIVVMLAATLPIVGVMAAASFQAVMLILLVPLAMLAAVLATFAFMTVTVDQSAITAKMGLGLVTRRVPLGEIRHVQAVRNPWYYGWGVRVYRGGTLYNVSGLSAVELMLQDGRGVRIGTDEPGLVIDALQGVMQAGASGGSHTDSAPSPPSAYGAPSIQPPPSTTSPS